MIAEQFQPRQPARRYEPVDAKDDSFIDLKYASRKAFSLAARPAAVVMVYEVVARKVFVAPTPWAYDISRMTVGASLAGGRRSHAWIHIRADFIYFKLAKRTSPCGFTYISFSFSGMVMFLSSHLNTHWRLDPLN